MVRSVVTSRRSTIDDIIDAIDIISIDIERVTICVPSQKWSMSTLRRSPDLGPDRQSLHLLLGEYPVPANLSPDAVLLGEMADLTGSDVETLGDLGGGEHCGYLGNGCWGYRMLANACRFQRGEPTRKM
jgi:hypothetical protein